GGGEILADAAARERQRAAGDAAGIQRGQRRAAAREGVAGVAEGEGVAVGAGGECGGGHAGQTGTGPAEAAERDDRPVAVNATGADPDVVVEAGMAVHLRAAAHGKRAGLD